RRRSRRRRAPAVPTWSRCEPSGGRRRCGRRDRPVPDRPRPRRCGRRPDPRASRAREPSRGARAPPAASAANRTSGPGPARWRECESGRCGPGSRGLQLLHFLGELGQGLEEVGDQSVVGHLEDRSLLVLVDGDDDLGVLHARQVLDRAGDADCDVQGGGDHLPGLTNLEVVRHEAGLDRGTAGAPGRAEPSAQARPSGWERGWGEVVKFSPFLRPRPPEHTIDASVSTGRSDLVSANSRNFILPSPADADTFSTAPLAPLGAGSNAVPRTEITRGPSSTLTVAKRLPAHMGRTNVVPSTIPLMSDTIPAP